MTINHPIGSEKLHINLAKLKKEGENFEVVVDPDLAIDFKHGKSVSIEEVLKDEVIFSDAHRGLKASEHRMQQVFGTSDPLEVAKVIIQKGDVQETAEHRAKLVEEKRKKIIGTIHLYAVDPKNHLPHPPARIEAALEEAKVKIDPRKSAEEQIDEIVKQIRVILPISMETKQVKIRIPATHAAKSYSAMKGFGKIIKDEWLTDGSLYAVLEMPAGIEQDFQDKINSVTHGNVEYESEAKK